MSNSVKSQSVTLDATGIYRVPSGNFFFLLEAGAPVDVIFYRKGTSGGAEGVLGGYVQGFVEPWDRATVDGPAGTTIAFLAGDAEIREDFTDYRRTVGIFRQSQPATISDAADVNVGGSAVAIQLVAANVARGKVTFTNLDTSVANVRVGAQATVAAGRGQRLRPGQSYTTDVTGDVWAIRETAAAALVGISFEVY